MALEIQAEIAVEPYCEIAFLAYRMLTISVFRAFGNHHFTLYLLAFYQFGAGGGTRTHTTFKGPRILSPVRLPFRHTGNPLFSTI